MKPLSGYPESKCWWCFGMGSVAMNADVITCTVCDGSGRWTPYEGQRPWGLPLFFGLMRMVFLVGRILR